MNKKYIKEIHLIILATTLLLSACYKDKGNYDYHDINELTITDAAAASRIFIYQGDTLKLNPVIQQTNSSDDLSYAWFVYNNSTNSAFDLPRDTIARTPSLSFKITGDIFMLGESYRLTLKVTDNKTGISSVRQYNLTISNKYGTGWMFLEEKGSGADLSMILPDGTIEHSIYSLLNPASPLGKPVSITTSQFDISDGLSDAGRRIYIQTENDAIELSALTLTKKFDIGYLFFAKPPVVKPAYIGWTAYSHYLGARLPYGVRIGLAINNGLMHTNVVGGFPGVKKWGDPIPNPLGLYDYEIAPYLASSSEYAPTYPTVVYDTKYKRFYSVTETKLIGFPAAASTVFDLNNVGLDLIAMDSSNVLDRWNAVMKDNANTPYLLQFRTQTTTSDPVATFAKTAMNAPGIAGASAIAASTLTPHIFYATGNKLYKYEITSNTYAEVYAFAANETVTKMDYQRTAPGTGQQRLVVATWNGTESKVYFFTVSSVGDLGGAYTNVFGGFNKIIDFAYKY